MAGKLDSRQKMINMMYLVFIAMLALNIGKEVLATLGVLNNDLESSMQELEEDSRARYELIEASSKDPNFVLVAPQVLEIKKEADKFYDFIQKIKDTLVYEEGALLDKNNKENKYLDEVIVKADGDEPEKTEMKMKYQNMDNSLALDKLFFDKDLLMPKGQAFVDRYKAFPISINNVLTNIELKETEFKVAKTALDGSKGKNDRIIPYDFSSPMQNLNSRFAYSEKIVNSEGTRQDFLKYNFYGFPVVASLAKLTKIQADIRYIENKVLTEVLTAILGGGSITSFQALLVTKKPVFYTNETVDAAVVMGKKDKSFKPNAIDLFISREGSEQKTSLIEGTDYKFFEGEVVLSRKFSSAGTYDLSGSLTKNNPLTQEPESIPVNQKIVIINEPNSAVVSADNMKVFYRGLRNPTSISIPGVASNTISPSSSGGKFVKVKGGWGAVPSSDPKITSMKVNVVGKLNGVNKSFNGGVFRIKEPPPGEGSVKVNDSYTRNTEEITSKYLINGILTGEKPSDFDYDFQIIVTSFDIKVGQAPVVSVKGNTPRVNSQATANIKSRSSGTIIRFSNVKAQAKDGDFVNPNYIVEDFIVVLK